jgi:hypothetical protein
LFLPWQYVILQQLASTFGSLKELMMCLHYWLIFEVMIGSPNIWLLACLK